MRIEWMENYLKEAEQLIYSNEVDRALALLNSLLYDEPGYSSLHNHLGWAYLYYTGDSAKAEMHLRMAIKFHPEFAPPYLHMGQLLIRLGRYSEAIEFLEKGLQKPEANVFACWESIGRAYELKAAYGPAMKAYRNAMVSSMAEHELNNLDAGIKRCRRKKWALFFSL